MAENFKKLLKERKITINSIATALKISSTTLYYFRDGKGSLTTKKLNALAEHLNVSTDYLLDKTVNPTTYFPPLPEPPENNEDAELLELQRQASESMAKLNETQRQYAIKVLELMKNMDKTMLEQHKRIMEALTIK